MGDTVVGIGLDPFSHIPIAHHPSQLDRPEVFLEACAARLRWVRAHLEQLSEYAADRLLPDFNEGDWCEGKPISAAEFVNRITPTGINIDQLGNLQVFFDDGDLFWGHAIIVDVGGANELRHATLFG